MAVNWAYCTIPRVTREVVGVRLALLFIENRLYLLPPLLLLLLLLLYPLLSPFTESCSPPVFNENGWKPIEAFFWGGGRSRGEIAREERSG